MTLEELKNSGKYKELTKEEMKAVVATGEYSKSFQQFQDFLECQSNCSPANIDLSSSGYGFNIPPKSYSEPSRHFCKVKNIFCNRKNLNY